MYLSRTFVCSGCKKSIKDSSDMLVENRSEPGQIVHVDHLTCIGLVTQVYGPYCDKECWDLDAREGDEFNDEGTFRFTDEVDEVE